MKVALKSRNKLMALKKLLEMNKEQDQEQPL